MPPSRTPAQTAWREAWATFLIVGVLVTILVRIHLKIPWIGELGSALVSVLFLWVPLVIASRHDEDLDVYGFRPEPVGKGLAIAGVSVAIIIPLFTLGFLGFYELVCSSPVLSHLAPRDMCSRYGGLAGLHLPHFILLEPDKPLANTISGEWCLVQLLVVALPEELFFRGMLLKKLEERFPPKRRILGGGVGLALVLSSVAFALIHLPKDGDPRALATFFPALLFGWMRSATGSILPSTITHGCANILVRLLELGVTR